MVTDHEADKDAEINRILSETNEKFTVLSNNLKNLRPDQPYALRFDPPGSSSRRPIGTRAKEEKLIKEQIDQLKTETYSSINNLTKDSALEKQHEALSNIDNVFYPGEDKGQGLHDRVARSKDLNSSMDLTEKVRLDEKVKNLNVEAPSPATTLQPNETKITPPKISTTLTTLGGTDKSILEDMSVNKSDIEKEPEI